MCHLSSHSLASLPLGKKRVLPNQRVNQRWSKTQPLFRLTASETVLGIQVMRSRFKLFVTLGLGQSLATPSVLVILAEFAAQLVTDTGELVVLVSGIISVTCFVNPHRARVTSCLVGQTPSLNSLPRCG